MADFPGLLLYFSQIPVPFFILFLIFFVLGIVALWTITIVGPDEVIISIHSLTGSRREVKTGINFLLPWIEYPVGFEWTQRQTVRGVTSTKTVRDTRLQLRDRTYDLIPQDLTFLDGERATIDAVFRWRISTPLVAIRVSDLLLALENTMQVALATVVSRIRLTDALSSRESLTRSWQAEVGWF